VKDEVAALRALELVGTAGFEGDIPGPEVEVILVPVYQVELGRIVVEQYPVQVEERAFLKLPWPGRGWVNVSRALQDAILGQV
jgi:hypothetical protein